MKKDATLEEIWERVNKETPSRLRGKVFGSIAESRGYGIEQINAYLEIVSPSEEYFGRTVRAPGKATIPVEYGVKNGLNLTYYLLGKTSDSNES